MYWYFDKSGNDDNGNDDNGDYQTSLQATSLQIHKNLNFQLPFFGFRFNYTRVRQYLYICCNQKNLRSFYMSAFLNKINSLKSYSVSRVYIYLKRDVTASPNYIIFS